MPGNMTLRQSVRLIFASLLLIPAVAYAAPQVRTQAPSPEPDPYQGSEHITDFAVNASLAPDRSLSFAESISYDFADNAHHGIYQYIPITYDRSGATYNLRLTVGSVTRDGRSEPYDQSTSDGDLNLKIGDPDVTMTGSHVYAVNFTTNRAINFFPDHDELYWNVTGNGWEVPIERASFSLTLPPGLDSASVSSTCFTGEAGSTENDCSIANAPGRITFTATRVLGANEGLTIVVGLPKGVIAPPTTQEKVMMVVSDNSVLFFPILAFVLMFTAWWFKGRDPKLGTVIPEYEPPQKLAPAVIGAAMTNGEVPGKTTTATIIDLARRGYLKIRFGKNKGLLGTAQSYTFVKQRDDYDGLTVFERDIQQGLFEGGAEQTIEDLKDRQFYQSVASFKRHVQEQIDLLKLFDARPGAIRSIFVTVAIIIGWLLVTIFGSTGLGMACAIATGLIIAIFGWFMPRRNADGVKLLTDIDGFKWFLSVTEKDRLDFHNAPERTPEQFMEFLPYAIVFDVEKKWAAQFASLNVPPPSWAEGSNMAGWNTALFVSNLSSLHSAASTSAYAAPSSAGSGGSGFSGGGSGGGFGGGGGGSW
jgi:uncharacterized membrane protein YgcG